MAAMGLLTLSLALGWIAPPKHFDVDRLVAWCIVPFDAKKRSPAERVAMLKELGLKRVAYDWRAEHVKEFDEEFRRYAEANIELVAYWGIHESAFDLFKKHRHAPQIWQTAPSPAGATEADRVAKAVTELKPAVERTLKAGLPFALYNHGGWGGEPANLVAVCQALRTAHGSDRIGIAYNLHHGHVHVEKFAEHLKAMRPYLMCLNLNGMTKGGDATGSKILPIGAGELDPAWLATIAGSEYRGPIGIIGHTDDDVKLRLQDNLDGLHWLRDPLALKPNYRTWPKGK
jgi:hypothetical protein